MAYFGPNPQTIQSGSLDSLRNLSDLSNVATARNNLDVLTPALSAMDARPNLIVNSSMQDSPENGTTLGTTNGYFPAEMWALYFTASTAAMSVQLISTRTLSGNDRAIEFKTTTAKAVLAATDFVTLTTIIEGSRPEWKAAAFGTAGAKPFVHRFETARPAGTWHKHVQNSAGNRHCSIPYTITAGEANTQVVKTVVIPADTSGVWLFGDGDKGLIIDDVLAAGATLTGGTASTWGATAYLAATTQFNTLSSTSNVARLADVGLKNDPDATAVYGLFRVGEVDAVYRAERYWEKSYDISVLPGATSSLGAASTRASSTFLSNSVSYKFRKCKAATPVSYSTTGASGQVRNLSSAADTPSILGGQGETGYIENAASASGNALTWQWTANARLS